MPAIKPWLEMLPVFEGRVSNMCLDTAGVVFCGVGCSLFSGAEAVMRFADPAASAEWAEVLKMPRGMTPDYYAARTKLRVSDPLIDSAFSVKTNWARIRLYAVAKDSDDWPAGVRDACLDIEYNTGALETFVHMLAAIRAGDWKTAAAESFRKPPIAEIRNDWTRDSILSALPAPPEAVT